VGDRIPHTGWAPPFRTILIGDAMATVHEQHDARFDTVGQAPMDLKQPVKPGLIMTTVDRLKVNFADGRTRPACWKCMPDRS